MRNKRKIDKQSPDRKYATVEEAAQAKTDQNWETVLKHVDWKKFDSLRRQK